MDFQNLACDDHALNLAGTFSDGAELHVAIELFYWIVFDEAVAAEELNGLVADFYSYFAGEEFGHGGFARGAAVRIFEHGGALGEQARGVELSGHVGQFPLDALELGDGFAKLAALLDVFQCSFERAAADAERERGDGDAAAIQGAHGVNESLAFRAEEVFFGDLTVFKDELAGVAGAQAELVLFLAGAESFGSFFNDEGRE